jgi:hypothetical protein
MRSTTEVESKPAETKRGIKGYHWLLVLAVAALISLPMVSRASDPTAAASLSNVSSAGATAYQFFVHYSDDGPIVTESIDDNDVRVSGPSGFDAMARLTSRSGSTATYSIVPPGSSWDSSDNGTYTAIMQPNQVTDELGNPVKAGSLGSFTVAVSGPPAAAQPLNVSTRLFVQSGDDSMIGGFIITGNAPKKVILRAIGPSLADHGVSDALLDPTLELHDSAGIIATNDSWKATQQSDIELTGVAPTDEREAALIATLPPGNYTAIVQGKGQPAGGVALMEVYDLDSAGDSKVANISTRGLIQTGTNVMIGGFIAGPGSRGSTRVIARALGPSLPLTGKLQDPTLEVVDGNGTSLASNDNWKQTQEQEIRDTTIPPDSDFEAAIVATIAPGNYTAIVRGAGGTSGVGLVEVYDLQ